MLRHKSLPSLTTPDGCCPTGLRSITGGQAVGAHGRIFTDNVMKNFHESSLVLHHPGCKIEDLIYWWGVSNYRHFLPVLYST